jgi:transposase InsO family protein
MLVNHKRVSRIMREDNLVAVQPRAFVVTTDSDHELEVYLNLASRMKLTGVNQLWVADITYIRSPTTSIPKTSRPRCRWRRCCARTRLPCRPVSPVFLWRS